MQSKKSSIIEILMNTGSGFIVSLVVTTVMQSQGLMQSLPAITITVIYTVVSLVRSYVWRRIFNNKVTKTVKVAEVELTPVNDRIEFI